MEHVREIGRAELGRTAGRRNVLGQSRGIHARRPLWARRSRPRAAGRLHVDSVTGRFSRRTSPTLNVMPVRSKYSSSGIAYLREVW